MRVSTSRLIRFETPRQGGPMIYPVTRLAMLSQLPLKYHFKYNWFFRFFCYSAVMTFPLWFWIDRKVNSPSAVAAWEAKKRADHEKEHIQHMWKDISGWYKDR